MLLRASGQRDEVEYDLAAITDASRDSGVPDADWLRALTEQAIRGEWGDLQTTRAEAARAMGEQQTTDVLVVASAFNGITRVADATGIPLDTNTAETTNDMRAAVGLDKFDYAEKTARFDPA